MRRAWKILIAFLVVLVALLVINTVVMDGQVKPAEVNVEGGEIMELSSVDLQVVDQPATGPGPEGATIVLLHCYACSLSWWEDVVPALNEKHRIIRFDLIGFGGSQKPGSGYSITDQSRAVGEALNEMGVEGALVVGHSMGGLVASSLAQTSSQLVDRVAVIGTASSISDDAALPFVAKLTYLPVLGEALWRVRPSSLVTKGYESAFAPGFDFEAAFENPDQVTDDADAMTFTSYKEASAESADFTDESTVAARMTESAVPLLGIFGSEDQIVDVEPTVEAYEAVPGAQVEVLDGVGHSPQIEAPEVTTRLLLPFAEGAPPPLPPGIDEDDDNVRYEDGGNGNGAKPGVKDKPKQAGTDAKPGKDEKAKQNGGKAKKPAAGN